MKEKKEKKKGKKRKETKEKKLRKKHKLLKHRTKTAEQLTNSNREPATFKFSNNQFQIV